MPSTRYAEIAPRVKAICERYQLPYNTGPFLQPARWRAAHDPASRAARRRAAAEDQARTGATATAPATARRSGRDGLFGHRGVGAQARHRLADDARDLHLRDADSLADLGLGEVLGEAQAQDLALARRDDPHDVRDGGAILRQGEAALFDADDVAEGVAAVLIGAPRRLQRRGPVGARGFERLRTCSASAPTFTPTSSTVGLRWSSRSRSETARSTFSARSCRSRGTRTDHVRSRKYRLISPRMVGTAKPRRRPRARG